MAGLFGSSCARGEGSHDLPDPAVDAVLAAAGQKKTAVLAAGCFWCTQGVFEQIPGVTGVVSGSSGDTRETANYDAVCSHNTNHAECVLVTYDASKTTYGKLLQVFFYTHDPTQLNGQGPDTGRQYRSAIFYGDDEQKKIAQAYIQQLNQAKAFDKPIVTTLEKLTEFYPAEDFHQGYTRNNPLQPYIQRYAIPKAEKARKRFSAEAAPTTQGTKKP